MQQGSRFGKKGNRRAANLTSRRALAEVGPRSAARPDFRSELFEPGGSVAQGMSDPQGSQDRAYWRDSVARYERASPRLALFDLATSALPYLVLLVAMYLSSASPSGSPWPWRSRLQASCCGHSSSSTIAPTASFLPTKRGNLWLGRLTGLLVFQPFANWRHTHAVHHGTSGDLDRRGTGDVDNAHHRGVFVSPLAGSARLSPVSQSRGDVRARADLVADDRAALLVNGMRPRQRRSVIATNLALGLLVAATIWLVGPRAWLLVQMPVAVLAGTAGVFLFYVQHQFEDAYWECGEQLELCRRGA